MIFPKKNLLITFILLCLSATSFAANFPRKTLGVVLFPKFELLDVFGPLEMFGSLPKKLHIILLAEKKGLVRSSQGAEIYVSTDLKHSPHLDYVLVPGGMGTRTQVKNKTLLSWLNQRAKSADIMISVCTGAALLAKANLLNHHKATSNKQAFNWVTQQSHSVNWIKNARWIDDGKVITSAGVAAGIDMSLHVIARLYGLSTAKQIAHSSEYIWRSRS